MLPLPTIASIATQLRTGAVSSQALTEAALVSARDAAGEGSRVFTRIDADAALAQARAADLLLQAGIDLGPLMGVPISLKDLFDIQGQVTTAGSTILAERAPAAADAPVVARLRQAGAVLIGRTNMVEFAYSGLGLNPHYGTPANPWDRATRRIPGGSSSGAAVSVTDGMAVAAIGTDTGGSVRIPAALCGLTGFKPTRARVSRDGAIPLSSTLDSIGPLAASVDCCDVVDRVLADQPRAEARVPELNRIRLVLPINRLLDALDEAVSAALERTVSRLRASGVTVIEMRLDALERLYGEINTLGSFSPPEAFAWHRELLAAGRARYDRRVAERIEKGAEMRASDYIRLLDLRAQFCRDMAQALAGYDALLMPTVARVAPPIGALEADDALYWQYNALMLRNTSMVNFLDGCAITLPAERPGEAPVGISLAQCHARDAALLALAGVLEPLIHAG